LLFYRKKKRLSIFTAQRKLAILIALFILSVASVFYVVNNRLTPTYLDYAEVQTNKIASMVISKAINSRTANVLDVNDIIEEVPSTNGSTNMVTTKFNTEIINRVLADTNSLVQAHLEQAEKGNLSSLPYLDDIEYDKQTMEDQGGVVFFVPMGQATNIPLIVKYSPFRKVVEPLLKFIESAEYEYKKGDMITVILPQFTVKRWWHNFLHNQTRVFVERELLKHKHIVVAVMPLQLKDDKLVLESSKYQ